MSLVDVCIAVATIATPVLLIAQMIQSGYFRTKESLPKCSISVGERGHYYRLKVRCYGGSKPIIFRTISVKDCLITPMGYDEHGYLEGKPKKNAHWSSCLRQDLFVDREEFPSTSLVLGNLRAGSSPRFEVTSTDFDFWLKPLKPISILEVRLRSSFILPSIRLAKPQKPVLMMINDAQIERNS